MNRWDALLGWLHRRQSAKWSQVKAASVRLSVGDDFAQDWPPLRHAYRWAVPLIQLGHAELEPSRKIMYAVPPGLVVLPQGNRALLCGYWSPHRWNLLKKSGLKVLKDLPGRGPTVVSLIGTREELRRTAADAAVWLSVHPGLEILRRLPPMDRLLENLPAEEVGLSDTWERLVFDRFRRRWIAVGSSFSEPGLYRRGRRYGLVDTEGMMRQVTPGDEQSAAMWILTPQRPWSYDGDRQRLLIPAQSAALPTLVMRALTAASGRLPEQERVNGRHWKVFESVDRDVAMLAGRVMGQMFDE